MKQSSIEVAVGVFVLIGIVCVGYLTLRLGDLKLLQGNYYHLYARFRSVTGLKVGAQVEIAGVQVGQVDAITLDRQEMDARVRLKIQNDIRLGDDVIASVKTAGLIGDKYIKLTPGGSEQMLAPGEMITETESALDIEELISRYAFGSIDKP